MMELAVPGVRQSTDYSCGPASLLSCFRYLKVDANASEQSLMRETRCSPANGTSADRMILAARKRASRVYFAEGLTAGDLRDLTRAGHLPILLLQAWKPEERAHVPYADTLADGHYTVCVAAGSRSAYFADPSLRGARARLTHRELGERWHEMENAGDGLRLIRGGAIIIEGPTPRLRRLGRTRPMG